MTFEGFFGGGNRAPREKSTLDEAYRSEFIDDAAGLVADRIGTLAGRSQQGATTVSIWNDPEYQGDIEDAVADACRTYDLSLEDARNAVIRRAKERLGVGESGIGPTLH